MEQENQIPESVQQTNDDSIVSKRSAARFGYFQDEYLRNFVTKPPRRSPLINRGYYIRCKVIRDILRQFLTKNPNYPKQIISLGAGFDTSYWILKGDLKIFNNFLHSYYEVDFEGVVSRKTKTITENDMLHSLLDKEVIESREQADLIQDLTQQLNDTKEKLHLVNQKIQEKTPAQANNSENKASGENDTKSVDLSPEDKAALAQLNRERSKLEELVANLEKQLKMYSTDDEIHRRGYHLFKGDLRDIATLEKKLKFCNIDWKKPTLIFAECVLTYIHPEDSDKIIQWISGAFDNVLLMTYEQVVPKDAFGRVMLQTLKGRGSPLFGTKLYSSVKLMRDRYTKLGFDRCTVADLLSFYKHSIGLEEVQRIEQIEDFDEYEEWNIKCGHYAISLASKEHNKDWAMFDQLSEYFPKKLEFDETYDGELKEMKPFESVHYSDPKLSGRSSSLKRWGHSAVVVTGHQILIFGGFGGDSKQQRLNDLVLVEPESFNCQLMEASGNIPEKRMFHAAEVFDGDKMLLFGGRASPKQPFGDLFVLETRLNMEKSPTMRWKQIEITGNQPSPRWRHSLTLFDHYVAEDKSKVFKFLVFGGRGVDVVSNAITALNDSYIIELTMQPNNDPSTGFSFTYKAKSSSLSLSEFTPSPRFSHTATLIAPNQVMVCGGANQMNRYFGDTFLFDTDHWTSVKGTGQLPTSLFSHSAVLIDNEQMNPSDLNFSKQGKSVLLIGGCSKRGTTFLYLLNLENYRWTKLYYDVGTPAIFVKHTASLINERKIVLIGGGALCFSFGTHLNPVKVLTLNANVITPRASFEIPVPDLSKIPGYGNIPRSVKMIGVKSEVPIETNPSPAKIEEMLANRRPVLIRGFNIGQCTEKWTPEYLKTKCIESKVSVRISKQPILDFVNKNYEFITVTFPEFMDKVFTEQKDDNNDRYYFRSIGENPRKDVSDIWRSFPDLATDFEIPEQFAFIKEKIFSSVFRISSQDIRMWTHYDVMDNILCQVVGSKKVVLWEPKEVKHLYVTGSTSKVLDIDNPDFDKFPKFAKANSMECVLEPGDILYIPACWWHNVITLSPSISINVFYKHLEDEAYTKKDLYGNKDLVQAEKAMEQLDQMISTLKTLPPYYQEFYANYLLSQFKSKTNL